MRAVGTEGLEVQEPRSAAALYADLVLGNLPVRNGVAPLYDEVAVRFGFRLLRGPEAHEHMLATEGLYDDEGSPRYGIGSFRTSLMAESGQVERLSGQGQRREARELEARLGNVQRFFAELRAQTDTGESVESFDWQAWEQYTCELEQATIQNAAGRLPKILGRLGQHPSLRRNL